MIAAGFTDSNTGLAIGVLAVFAVIALAMLYDIDCLLEEQLADASDEGRFQTDPDRKPAGPGIGQAETTTWRRVETHPTSNGRSRRGRDSDGNSTRNNELGSHAECMADHDRRTAPQLDRLAPPHDMAVREPSRDSSHPQRVHGATDLVDRVPQLGQPALEAQAEAGGSPGAAPLCAASGWGRAPSVLGVCTRRRRRLASVEGPPVLGAAADDELLGRLSRLRLGDDPGHERVRRRRSAATDPHPSRRRLQMGRRTVAEYLRSLSRRSRLTEDVEGDGRVRWFGKSWGAPVCDPRYRSAAPLGEFCLGCDELVVDGDRGLIMASHAVGPWFWWWLGDDEHIVVAYHVDCFERTIGEARTPRREEDEHGSR